MNLLWNLGHRDTKLFGALVGSLVYLIHLKLEVSQRFHDTLVYTVCTQWSLPKRTLQEADKLRGKD